MTDQTTGPVDNGGALTDGLTDAEKLTALQSYMKALDPMEKALRASVVADMRSRRVERVGAYLPGGDKIGTVGFNAGRKSAGVIDHAAALRWALDKYPDEIVKAVNPAFLKALTDHAAKVGEVGEPGVDPTDGEMLDFIQVKQGNAYVTVTPTKEGIARMNMLAYGFAGMLEDAQREPGLRAPAAAAYDPDMADRLMNGAYER